MESPENKCSRNEKDHGITHGAMLSVGGNLFLWVVGLMFSCIQMNAQPMASINGFPMVADTVTHTIYVPIEDHSEDSIAITLDSPHLSVFRWDGVPVDDTGCIYVNDWHSAHEFCDSCEEGMNTWKVVFTSLPLVCLYFDQPELMGDEDASCSIRIFSPAILTEGNRIFESKALAHYRGGSSRYYAKKNFLVSLTDSAGKERDVEVMAIRTDSKWILNAMGADLSRFRNQLCFDIWNDVSSLRPGDNRMVANGIRGHLVEVILNGRYAGVYQFSDKVNRKMLGVKKSSLGHIRGLVYKCEADASPTAWMTLPDNYLEIYNPAFDSFCDWVMKYPDNIYNDETWQPLLELLKFTSMAEEDPEWVDKELDNWMCRENVADYVLFVMALMLKDNCMHNVYLSLFDHEKDHRFWITPWDLDASFGRSGWAAQTNYPAVSQELLRGLLYYLYELKGGQMRNDIIERWDVLKQTTYNPLSVTRRIYDYAQLLQRSGAWQREVEAWQDSIVVPTGEVLHLATSAWDEAYYMMMWYLTNYSNLDQTLLQREDDKDMLGLENVTLKSEDKDNRALYDMMGRKLNTSHPAPGLYLRGGKKIIIRQ